MLTMLHNFLGGSSPVTGYLGSVIIILDAVNQAFVQGDLPKDLGGWIAFVGTFLTGLALRFAKDANRSNAPHPTENPTVVE